MCKVRTPPFFSQSFHDLQAEKDSLRAAARIRENTDHAISLGCRYICPLNASRCGKQVTSEWVYCADH